MISSINPWRCVLINVRIAIRLLLAEVVHTLPKPRQIAWGTVQSVCISPNGADYDTPQRSVCRQSPSPQLIAT